MSFLYSPKHTLTVATIKIKDKSPISTLVNIICLYLHGHTLDSVTTFIYEELQQIVTLTFSY